MPAHRPAHSPRTARYPVRPSTIGVRSGACRPVRGCLTGSCGSGDPHWSAGLPRARRLLRDGHDLRCPVSGTCGSRPGVRAKMAKPGKQSYVVRWVVAGQEFPKTYATSKQAESFRSKLVVAQCSGEAFRVFSGLPVSMARAENDKPWFTFAQAYVDMKWRRAAANSRSSNADALATATLALPATSTGGIRAGPRMSRRRWRGWARTRSRCHALRTSRCSGACWISSR